MRRYFRRLFRCSFRPEVVSGVISGADVEQVGMVVPVKFAGSRSNGSRDIQQRSRRIGQFRQFLNFDNCQPEVVGDVESGTVIRIYVRRRHFRPLIERR